MKNILTEIASTIFTFARKMDVPFTKFKDVSIQHPVVTEILYVTEQKLMHPIQEKMFFPNQLVTKEQLAVILAKALRLPIIKNKKPSYKDLDENDPNYMYIVAAYNAEIFKDAPSFKPNTYVSRAYLAQIIAEAFQLKPIPYNIVKFSDVSMEMPQKQAIQLLGMNNIEIGEYHDASNCLFKPNELATRADIAKFVARAKTLQQHGASQYMPNKGYTYYYDIVDGYAQLSFEIYDYAQSGYPGYFGWWRLVDDAGRLIGSIGYQENREDSFLCYSEELFENVICSVELPATIGQKNGYNFNTFSMRQDVQQVVVDTDAQLEIGDHLYNHVLIIEEQGRRLQKRTVYIARGYGIIGIQGADGTWQLTLDGRYPVTS